MFEIEVEPFVGEVPVIDVGSDGTWRETGRRLYRALKPTQIAIFADACNDCGNCDVFCPEDGGPQIEKPRFFGSLESWRRAAPLTGFVLTREDDALVLRGRMPEGDFVLTHVPGSDQADSRRQARSSLSVGTTMRSDQFDSANPESRSPACPGESKLSRVPKRPSPEPLSRSTCPPT